ncbi:hypothetical protein BN946_scf184708.g8 [Trametes cinnabarina]|uniref:Uncharacterized protein n=1 Tax=Pycnoporus cinnabarinus TaxID=5643 RepID=A0A060T0L2_PYCCI|nr:hypothetical protein BN946_scf184708.g8 [Trametes cinnabarina]
MPTGDLNTQDGEYKDPEGNKLTLIVRCDATDAENDPSGHPERLNYYAAKIKELGYDPRAPFGMDELPVPRKVAVPIDFANTPCIVRLPFELVPNVKPQFPAFRDLEVLWTPHEGLGGRGWKEEMLVRLASLPELRKTRVYLSGMDFAWLKQVSVNPPFPALVDIMLEAPSLDYCTAFIRTRLGNTSSAPTRLWLTAFHALRTFTLDLSSVYELGNSFPQTVLSAFPLLEKLSLGTEHGWCQRPSIGFAGLAQLVKACPMLEQLCISIDVMQHEMAAIPSRSNTRLRILDLSDSCVLQDLGRAVLLPKTLAALLPEMERIHVKTSGWRQKELEEEGEDEKQVDVPAVKS